MKTKMQKVGRMLLVGLVLMTVGSMGLGAEQSVPMHNLFIFEECVEPAQMDAFMKGRAEQTKLAAKHDFEFPVLRFVDNFKVVTCGVFEKFAAIDEFPAILEEYVKKTGGRDKELDDLCAKCVRSASSSIAVYRPDLSYHAKNPAFTPDYSKPFFTVMVTYHVKPHKYDQAVEVAKKIKDLYEKRGASASYRIYERMCGEDVPVFFGVMCAQDKAQFLEIDKKDQERFGAEAERLFDANLDIVNAIESSEAMYVPEISYMPKQASGEGQEAMPW